MADLNSNAAGMAKKKGLNRLAGALAGACALAAAIHFGMEPARAASAVAIPAAAQGEAPSAAKTETAVFAGGCFWGVQGVFQHVKGVTQAVSGYAGGAASTAHYETVSTGSTGHAESVEVMFDPAQVSYAKLLQIYFSAAHDPTQVDRQAPDSGTQYRSALFPMTASQRGVAQAYIAQLNAAKVFGAPIATRVEPFSGFYPAEAHHQNFLELHPTQGYIAAYDLPKLAELRTMFPAQWREKAVLVPDAS